PWALAVIEAPLRVLTQQRELEAAAQGHREATRTTLETLGVRHRLDDPRRRVLERGARDLDGLGEARVRGRRAARFDLGGDRLEGAALAERAQGVEREDVGGALPDRQ